MRRLPIEPSRPCHANRMESMSGKNGSLGAITPKRLRTTDGARSMIRAGRHQQGDAMKLHATNSLRFSAALFALLAPTTLHAQMSHLPRFDGYMGISASARVRPLSIAARPASIGPQQSADVALGVDVSVNQSPIDWSTLKNSGRTFVFVL